ncbi:hypothetical protein DPMN_170491 [Dreissena polymorpha]|uniref:Uncharacterized protein n=1 Tax=Dreissena polymorpha TaxID=45954 RepID=A0A9D4DWA5_DREPO|nr:hypothetical protein DPMN_170491 [Dreissena polymorpha]
MSQERLTALELQSIECQVLRELDFTQLIDDFGQLKCRIRDLKAGIFQEIHNGEFKLTTSFVKIPGGTHAQTLMRRRIMRRLIRVNAVFANAIFLHANHKWVKQEVSHRKVGTEEEEEQDDTDNSTFCENLWTKVCIRC